MSRLGDLIRAMIEEQGPIDIARYMTLALAHPDHGYYPIRAALGAEGDFVTAPEVSQIFGELVGAVMAQAWLDRGGPDPFALVELGPGRGTLLADLLRATRRVPGFHDAMRLHLVETSPKLRRLQAEALPARPLPSWQASLEEVPGGMPLFVIANEFVDALPIRQYVRTGQGWRERVVGLDAADRLSFRLSRMPAPIEQALGPAAEALPEGAIIETSPVREAFAAELGQRLEAAGGLALVIDYGERDPDPGDSLQAVQGHAKVDPLAAPGACDLTAHVDFGAFLRSVRARASGVQAFGPVTQAAFLKRLGIHGRLARLIALADEATAARLEAGVRRLTDAAAMGVLFKVAALDGDGLVPPGFLEEERFAP